VNVELVVDPSVLTGGSGNDAINGGLGNDVIRGGIADSELVCSG
jgi:Ca2+-binding RTX toxin-like protein